jgi:predicted Zn-dependent protease with MMP-like domain
MLHFRGKPPRVSKVIDRLHVIAEAAYDILVEQFDEVLDRVVIRIIITVIPPQVGLLRV